MDNSSNPERQGHGQGRWTESEHECFLQGLKLYPQGPWRAIANYIGTRSVKQVQTHAQKYQQKIERWNRGLRKNKKISHCLEHRVDDTSSGHIETVIRLKARLSGSPGSPFARQTSEEESTFDDLVLASRVKQMNSVLIAPQHHSHEHAFHPIQTGRFTIDTIDLTSLVEQTDPLPFVPGYNPQEFDDIDIEEFRETLAWLLACP